MSSPPAPANNLYQLLNRLLSEPQSGQWVAATVLTKYRSSYRKPGAMMLVSPLGRTLGLISGGCLESDTVQRARRVLEYGAAEYVIYDSMEDGNIAAELGLGCNGRIGVLVEEITSCHRRLYRDLVERMKQGLTSYLLYAIDDPGEPRGFTAVLDEQLSPVAIRDEEIEIPTFSAADASGSELLQRDGQAWSLIAVKPPVRLLIAGGGVDAQPVAELAARLGWRVTVADPRTVNARRQDFPAAESRIDTPPHLLEEIPPADAVIVMSHNLEMDAQWLARCQRLSTVKYVGLLGPVARKEEVLAIAGIDPAGEFGGSIHGPMGLDIGGDLPESVAVSVIAQCHQVLAAAGLL